MTQPRPLRILHLTAASESGGLSRYLLDLCRGLHDRGHQVAIAGARGAWHHKFTAAPWPWIDLSLRGGPLALLQASRTLRNYLADHPIDLLHTHYRRATLVARRAAPKLLPPILYTVHLSGIPLRIPWRWLSDFGDHTHAPSQGALDWLKNDAHLSPRNITLIPHGIDIARFPQPSAEQKIAARSALGLSQGATIAAFVARLDYPKNAQWMLDLAEASRSRLPDLQIVLAGDGPDAPALKQAIHQKNLAGRVILLGERDVLPVYHAADALLLPSLREGFGLVCAEAMCTALPVLRTHTSGAEELIVDGITGRSVPIDRQNFIDASIDFLSDRPALEKMGQAASRHIRRNFTLDRQIDQTIDLYHRLAIKPKS